MSSSSSVAYLAYQPLSLTQEKSATASVAKLNGTQRLEISNSWTSSWGQLLDIVEKRVAIQSRLALHNNCCNPDMRSTTVYEEAEAVFCSSEGEGGLRRHRVLRSSPVCCLRGSRVYLTVDQRL